jgi:glycosyltransferase involved in cell wall biosynthesis
MKIGFLLQAVAAVGGLGNGVRMQGLFQAEALSRLGHQVSLMNPWDLQSSGEFEFVHLFGGGFGYFGIQSTQKSLLRRLAFSPIIDSNQSFGAYALAAKLGAIWPERLFTVPGELAKQAHAANVIVCRSAHEKERMVRSLRADPDKCEIVLNGVEPPPLCNTEMVRERLKLPDRFVLHVSAYTQERKNVARMIEAIGPTGFPLVIAGTEFPGATRERLVALSKKYERVRLLGWQERQTLHELYSACSVFCLPSVHEGTGLVALEAAASGAEVVITKRGGPPDYFLNMAEYVDPFDVDDIRAGVERAWNKKRTDHLQSHVLRQLTWDQSAKQLLNAYQKHQQRS